MVTWAKPLLKQGCLLQIANHIHVAFEDLQGGTPHNLSGQPVPVSISEYELILLQVQNFTFLLFDFFFLQTASPAANYKINMYHKDTLSKF